MTVGATNTNIRASGRPRTGGWSGKYQSLGRTTLSADEAAEAERQLAELETDPSVPVSTALRWGRAQLAVVRRAASLAGVPYQTYLKEAAFRTALHDLQAARAAGVLVEARRTTTD
jgi:hypothetical protein